MIEIDIEASLVEVVDAIEAVATFSEGLVSGPFKFHDDLPEVHLGLRDGRLALVMIPIAIPLGNIIEMKDKDGNVIPKFKLKIRLLLMQLQEYRQEFLVHNGELDELVLQSCMLSPGNSMDEGEPFFMSLSCGDQPEQPLGIVMITGAAQDDKGRILWYYRKQGLLWVAQYIKLYEIKSQESFILRRMPEMIKDD